MCSFLIQGTCVINHPSSAELLALLYQTLASKAT